MAKMKKRTKIILIVVAIVVIAAIGVGVWYWNKKKKEAEEKDKQTKEQEEQPDKTAEIDLSDASKTKVAGPPESERQVFDINELEKKIEEQKKEPEIRITKEQTALKTAKLAKEDLKKTKMQS